MGDLLQISPQELKFRFELKRNVPVTMSLTNLGDERVAFKVKTTSPKKYSVRPSTGVIEPGASKEIQVIMQAQREYPSSLSDCKDKFLVQATRVGKEVTDVSADLFEPGSAKEIKQSKLRVIMVGPPKPPSPVPEGVEEEASPPKTTFSPQMDSRFTEAAKDSDPNSEVAKLIRERNRLKDLLTKAEGDKSNLTKRLEAIGQPSTSGLQTQKTLLEKGHYTLLHLAFFAFIAFIVGLMIGNRGS